MQDELKPTWLCWRLQTQHKKNISESVSGKSDEIFFTELHSQTHAPKFEFNKTTVASNNNN